MTSGLAFCDFVFKELHFCVCVGSLVAAPVMCQSTLTKIKIHALYTNVHHHAFVPQTRPSTALVWQNKVVSVSTHKNDFLFGKKKYCRGCFGFRKRATKHSAILWMMNDVLLLLLLQPTGSAHFYTGLLMSHDPVITSQPKKDTKR